ncbi:MAG: 2-hydroxyacyl-CoA dehydratase family protein [Pseudomonadota bacterium]
MSASAITTLEGAFEKPFGELGRMPEHDRSIVVASWPSVPTEVICAAGFLPVFARGSAAPTPNANTVLEPGVFPGRIHQLFEAALTGRLAHVAAIVLPRTSDPDYKAFLYLKEFGRKGVPLPPVLLFDLLQSGAEGTAEYNKERIRQLLLQLTQLAGRHVAIEALREQIAQANEAREMARRIAQLRTGRPRLAGTDAMPLLGAFWQLPFARYRALAGPAVELIDARTPRSGPRLLLAGSPLDSPALLAWLEAQHCTVVADSGPFSCGAAADVDITIDPLVALASWYVSNPLTGRVPGATQMQRAMSALPGIDAAVVLLPPHDARFGWEYPRLRALFAGHGIPHLVIRTEPESELDTRVQQDLRALLDLATRVPAVQRG